MVVEAEKQIFGYLEQILLRKTVSSCCEVIGSKTSGCHGWRGSDSRSVGPGQGDSGNLDSGSGLWLLLLQWSIPGPSLLWGQKEMGEGISPVPEGSQGTGDATADFQSGTHVGSRSRRICASHTSSWPRKCISDLGFKRIWSLDYPGGPWLRIYLLIQGTQVWSLVRELRSHMLWGK